MIVVDHDQDGTPILLRNISSNDGIWQTGERIYVLGVWDEGVPAPELPAADDKQKQKKRYTDLQAGTATRIS